MINLVTTTVSTTLPTKVPTTVPTFCSSCPSTGFTTEYRIDYNPGEHLVATVNTSLLECISKCKLNVYCKLIYWRGVDNKCYQKSAVTSGPVVSSISGMAARMCSLVEACPDGTNLMSWNLMSLVILFYKLT